MKDGYCPECESATMTSIEKREEVVSVKGKRISVESSVLVCDTCGRDIFDEELDNKNLETAYRQYRAQFDLLFPKEIKEIRQKYDLSPEHLARFLEWPEDTIRLHEGGAVQDGKQDEVLKSISKPENMLEIYKENSCFLPQEVRTNLNKRINMLLSDETSTGFVGTFSRILSEKGDIDIYSGYKRFDLEKLFHMILYITASLGGTFQTKLNKLLWYVDFLHFKEYTVSMSGSNYVHLDHGPVADHYRVLLDIMEERGLIRTEEVIIGKNKTGVEIRSAVAPDRGQFSPGELNVLGHVTERFKGLSCKGIKERSHNERGYKETKDKERISYEFAGALSLRLPRKTDKE